MTTFSIFDGTLCVARDLVDLGSAKSEAESYLRDCNEDGLAVTIADCHSRRVVTLTSSVSYSVEYSKCS